MNEVVNKLEDAEVGDLVWLFDSNRNAYDNDGKYIGRGAWSTTKITGKTRLSLECHQTKFMMNGVARSKNGFHPGLSIYGQKEKEDQEWIDKNHYNLVSNVQGTKDIETLKKIAELVGYKEKT